jgi:ribosome-associated protein
MELIKIDSDYITLGQLLKMTDCIQSGGQAKFFLENHIIYVNQQLENRRGKKLVNHDIIEIKGIGTYKIYHF